MACELRRVRLTIRSVDVECVAHCLGMAAFTHQPVGMNDSDF